MAKKKTTAKKKRTTTAPKAFGASDPTKRSKPDVEFDRVEVPEIDEVDAGEDVLGDVEVPDPEFKADELDEVTLDDLGTQEDEEDAPVLTAAGAAVGKALPEATATVTADWQETLRRHLTVLNTYGPHVSIPEFRDFAGDVNREARTLLESYAFQGLVSGKWISSMTRYSITDKGVELLNA
jgi:hypothetical protein